MGSEPSSSEPECHELRIAGKHCFEHANGRCCTCGVTPAGDGPPPCTCGPDEACGDPCEPPMTPEEEEQAPPDDELDCVCGHEPCDHAGVMGTGECGECECVVYRTKPDFELPPQPDRRPPYAVAYSVQGHLYEVALPGDASVQAMDGALVIQHALGPVAAICQVLPVNFERQA